VAHLREPPIGRHEARDHRCDELGGLEGLPIFASKFQIYRDLLNDWIQMRGAINKQ
jgi:hypothetical protein